MNAATPAFWPDGTSRGVFESNTGISSTGQMIAEEEAFRLLISADNPQQFVKVACPGRYYYYAVYNEIMVLYRIEHLGVAPKVTFKHLLQPCYYCFEFHPYTLADMIAFGPLPLAAAAGIADKVHKLLYKLNSQQIVHGNIVPYNVVLTAEFAPLLINFESAYDERDPLPTSFAEPPNLPVFALFYAKSAVTNCFQLMNLLLTMHRGSTLFEGDEFACQKQFLQLFGRPDFSAFSSTQITQFFRPPDGVQYDYSDVFGDSVLNWPLVPAAAVLDAWSPYDSLPKHPGGIIEDIVGQKLGFMCRHAMCSECSLDDEMWALLLELGNE